MVARIIDSIVKHNIISMLVLFTLCYKEDVQLLLRYFAVY